MNRNRALCVLVATFVSYAAPASAQDGDEVNTFRATEIFIDEVDAITGTTMTVNLEDVGGNAQNLNEDYFVFVRGSDYADNIGAGVSTGPNVNYFALTGDPFGTGDLATTGAANRLQFTRGGASVGATFNWRGVITVVERVQAPRAATPPNKAEPSRCWMSSASPWREPPRSPPGSRLAPPR